MNNLLKIDKSELMCLSQKDLMTLCYCFMKTDKENKVKFTINELKLYYGYSVNNKHSNNDFKIAITNLINKGYIKGIGSKEYLYKARTIEDNYVMLSLEEIKKIKDYEMSGHKINWDNILYCYLTIKSFINMAMDLKYCFLSHERISMFSHLSKTTIHKTIKELINIGLLKVYDFGAYKNKKGILKMSSRVYAIEGNKNDIKRDYEVILGGMFVN